MTARVCADGHANVAQQAHLVGINGPESFPRGKELRFVDVQAFNDSTQKGQSFFL